jgi:hypothetical protein
MQERMDAAHLERFLTIQRLLLSLAQMHTDLERSFPCGNGLIKRLDAFALSKHR